MIRICLAPLALVAALAGPALAQTAPSLADLTAAAQAGDTAAQIILGQRYLDGDGTLQNHAQAALWFAQAAEAGDAQAQNILGKLYFTGRGVARDPAQAQRWLEAAATNGTADYLFDLATVLDTDSDPGDAPRAAALYLRAANAGHAGATVSLGVLYQQGKGVDQDFDEARRLYERGVALGDARAQNNLGLLYVRGDGVAQDYQRAAVLFQAAADQGLRTAMTNLGVLYENGFGVALNEARAAALYRQGGGQDSAAQTTQIAFPYDPRLTPVPRDAAGLETLEQAARADDPVALFQLGWLTVTARGADFGAQAQARGLFQRAADRGHGPAMANLSWMYFEGLGGSQDYMLGHMWMLMAKRAGASTQALDMHHAQTATTQQVNAAQTRAADLLSAMGQQIKP